MVEYRDDLNMFDLLREMWQGRLFLLCGMVIGLLAAAAFMFMVVGKYEARILVVPADPMQAQIQTQMRSQGGGAGGVGNAYVFAVDGLNAGGDYHDAEGVGVTHFMQFEAMIRGQSVARLLLRDDKIKNGVQKDHDFIVHKADGALNAALLADYVAEHVTFDAIGETPLRALVYRHADGDFAAYFLQQLHRVTDQLIRAEARARNDERIAYLERVIARSVDAEQRRVITNLLLEQERHKMMLSMDAAIAARVIEAASVSADIRWPNAAFVYVAFSLIGVVFGYVVFGFVKFHNGERGYVAQSIDGHSLRHQPKKSLKYGDWFKNDPENTNDPDGIEEHDARMKRDASDAAE